MKSLNCIFGSLLSALVLAGCSGEGMPDEPYNPIGTEAPSDLGAIEPAGAGIEPSGSGVEAGGAGNEGGGGGGGGGGNSSDICVVACEREFEACPASSPAGGACAAYCAALRTSYSYCDSYTDALYACALDSTVVCTDAGVEYPACSDEQLDWALCIVGGT